jgi:hypothetical protein
MKTKPNLNVHNAPNASAAYRANLAEAQRLAAALLNRLQNMSGDVAPNDWPAAGSMAHLRIAIEELP